MDNEDNKNAKVTTKAKDTFFAEKPIFIDLEDGNSFHVFMRPLRIKEISVLNRIIYLQEKDKDSEQAGLMLMDLTVECLNVTDKDIPAAAMCGLVEYFIEYNFPKKNEDEPKTGPEKTNRNGIVDCFDFLISNGHKNSDIMEYTIPRFNQYIEVVSERLGLKKKPVGAEEAFRKIGIPIRRRNPQGQ
jgi:hypothetical protein